MFLIADKPQSSVTYDFFDRLLPRTLQPAFKFGTITIDNRRIEIRENAVIRKPFCTLIHFQRDVIRTDPKLLIVAPLSGHFAVMLRDMVGALLPEHEVYVTDWTDARLVPVKHGPFGVADNIGYVLEFVRCLGPEIHLIGLCQSAIPTLAAAALLAAEDPSIAPRSLILLGGPVDPRIRPTRVERLLAERPLDWFEQNVIATVPPAYPAVGRRVYPSSFQLMALMAYLARHVGERRELFYKLAKDDGEDAASHPFAALYTSVMDLAAEFFIENVQAVFQDFTLPRGVATWHGQPIDLASISRTSLLTVEAELDDISAPGQTEVAHELCVGVPSRLRAHHCERGIGHFGLFHGRRWRTQFMPRVRGFVRSAESFAGRRAL